MEGFPPSSAEDDVVIDWTSNEFDLQSLEDIFNIPEPLSYVILKHIISKDDSLQFSYSSVFSIIPKKKQVATGGSRQPKLHIMQ
jgi:hypothetical protein